ncbi:MAG TPA: hypothetical protein VGP99_02185, partial [Tepidisphaeraceae bacterium]|nr:hypothetical protein [Tepidisphaeraceae bacterium]
GGGGVVTDYMLVDGTNPSQRSIWAVVDTLYDVGGVGGRVEFYQDSVLAANKLPETGVITYPNDRLDQIARIEIDTTDAAADDAFARYDNILVTDAVPEPAIAEVLMIGTLCLLRRYRD